MCGIFGYFNKDGRDTPKEQIAQMGILLKHRGPDDQGIYYFNGGALGNQRLSIIDPKGGHQPFMSDDEQIIVVQNGEIFNHIELANDLKALGVKFKTNSDTEVILRLYEHYGIDFISQLNGMFAISIYDKKADCMYIIRDRIGVKPLYLYRESQNIFFSSEIKSFFPVGLSKKISFEALDLYLSFNYIPLPHTIYKNVTHLMPGHFIKISKQGEQTHRWWDLANRESIERTEESWSEEFMALLSDAVRIRLRSDVQFGAFLSGGVDSSTIVGLMAQHLNEPAKTFCIGFDDPKYDESAFALEAATLFKTNHTMEIVAPNMIDLWPKAMYHCDQPHGDMSFLPTYRVSKLASQHVKMVLTGDGGDELFGGYEKYLNFFSNAENLSSANSVFQEKYFNNISLFDEQSKQLLYNSKTKEHTAPDSAFKFTQDLYSRSAHMDRINQALYIDTMQLLPGNNLPKPDRMGMAVSIEARTPFLDYRVVELAFTMPGHLKIGQGQTKYLLKKCVTPLIGQNLAYRKKQMFTVPVGDWFKTTLSAYCYKNLLEKNSISKNIFNETYINKMLSEHINGKANYTREIRALLAIEQWAQAFDISPDEII